MIQKRATSVAFFILSIFALSHISIGLAQDAVYRCGNEYTNDVGAAKRAECQRVAGTASVTIPAAKSAMEVKKPSTPSTPSTASNTRGNKSLEQQARDADARRVIEAELKKSETQRVDLGKQYEQLSSSQDLERKLALKQQLARLDADIVSLKRELKR
jgi:hypothetical protein